jgi:hypothetical protein
MITLSENDLLGSNQTRDVYLHPHFPDRVLKIERRPVPGRFQSISMALSRNRLAPVTH